MKDNIEELFPGYFEETLDQQERDMVEGWINLSAENIAVFYSYKRSWEAAKQLDVMKSFDHSTAMEKVHNKIKASKNKRNWLHVIQKYAAILLIPIGVAFIILLVSKTDLFTQDSPIVYNTIESKKGTHSEFMLPDCTIVWLNAGSRLTYPVKFNNKVREVYLVGEAFFDVSENKKHPFIVNTGKINIEVLGTRFNIEAFESDEESQIVLESGLINLFSGDYKEKRDITRLHPGERAIYSNISSKLTIDNVETRKFTAWKEGKLIFIDDPLSVVIEKINRRFNVDIHITDIELRNYIYTATLENESLSQVLHLLQLSAPIEYDYLETNGAQKKILMKKRE